MELALRLRQFITHCVVHIHEDWEELLCFSCEFVQIVWWTIINKLALNHCRTLQTH